MIRFSAIIISLFLYQRPAGFRIFTRILTVGVSRTIFVFLITCGIFLAHATGQFKIIKILSVDSAEISMDYEISLDKLKEQCNFSYTDKQILEETFPLVLVPGKEKIKVFLMRFRTPVLSDTVIKYFDASGLAPASMRELLVFGNSFPKYQNKAPVVSLNTAQNTGDGKFIPMIEKTMKEPTGKPAGDSGNNSRDLLLAEWEGYWRQGTCFIAVRKKLRIDTLGQMKYEDFSADELFLNCTADKEFKKIEIKLPNEKKGKSAQFYLVNSPALVTRPDLLRKVKKVNKKFQPGTLTDLIMARGAIINSGKTVLAQGITPGQNSEQLPMLNGPGCHLQMIIAGNDFKYGPEVCFLFVIPSVKK